MSVLLHQSRDVPSTKVPPKSFVRYVSEKPQFLSPKRMTWPIMTPSLLAMAVNISTFRLRFVDCEGLARAWPCRKPRACRPGLSQSAPDALLRGPITASLGAGFPADRRPVRANVRRADEGPIRVDDVATG